MMTLGNGSSKNTTNNTQNTTQNAVSDNYIVENQNNVYSENSIVNQLTNALENETYNPIQEFLNYLNQKTTTKETKKDENV